VLREHSPIVLSSLYISGGTPPPSKSHPLTSQGPKKKNHTRPTVSDTVTVSDILNYFQHSVTASLLLHHPLLIGGHPSDVPHWHPLTPHPIEQEVVLDEFLLTQVIIMHTHKGTLKFTP
jgi:hypothetical protein